jgi:hypothetical protein
MMDLKRTETTQRMVAEFLWLDRVAIYVYQPERERLESLDVARWMTRRVPRSRIAVGIVP